MTNGHGTSNDILRATELAARLQKAPGDIEALVEYGSLLFEPLHETEAARGLLSKASGLRPDDVRSLFWLAKIAVHRDCDDEAARTLLERAISIAPSDPACLSLLVTTLRSEPDEADRCWALAQRLSEVAPDWPRAHEVMAEVARQRGAFDEARRGFQAALNAALAASETGGWPASYFEEAVSGRYVTSAALERLREALQLIP